MTTSLRSAAFPEIATRLLISAKRFAGWAQIAQAVADQTPQAVPAVVVTGVSRPVEAHVLARAEQDSSAHLESMRVAAIQAALHLQLALHHAVAAERAHTGRDTTTVDHVAGSHVHRHPQPNRSCET
ncbi:hypothetical protein JOD54_001085 [Actinokineospora baliensis]|uniref:hypothetical protein n=1 Tax=Actinokineospora baliensis TaxID=547056 RepID=UPI00195A0D32|nr:hypothetical protein [Actinokineospora baliensis]MBM7770881.1 hypothetical protein [Actinokineospora baliensis]